MPEAASRSWASEMGPRFAPNPMKAMAAFAITEAIGFGEIWAHGDELMHTLFHHARAIGRIFCDHALFVVLGARREMHAAFDAGNDARRNAVIGEREALVFAKSHAAVAHEFAPIHGKTVQLQARNRLFALAQRLLGQHKDGQLVLFSEIERRDREVKRFFNRTWYDDDLGDLAMAREDNMVEVALLGLRGHAR